jgi:hypothetical protein
LQQEGELRQRQQQAELEQKRKEQEQQAVAAANAQQSPYRRQITVTRFALLHTQTWRSLVNCLVWTNSPVVHRRNNNNRQNKQRPYGAVVWRRRQ